jgi:hypothetical protein
VADLDVSGIARGLAFAVFPPLEPVFTLAAFERWGIAFLVFIITASAQLAYPVHKGFVLHSTNITSIPYYPTEKYGN